MELGLPSASDGKVIFGNTSPTLNCPWAFNMPPILIIKNTHAGAIFLIIRFFIAPHPTAEYVDYRLRSYSYLEYRHPDKDFGLRYQSRHLNDV